MRNRISALILAGLLLLSGWTVAFSQTLEEVRLEDDFYTAVNAQWLENANLTENQVSMGGFQDLARSVHAQLMQDFAGMEAEQEKGPLREFLRYYDMALDYKSRDAMGREPILPYIRRIAGLESLAELNAVLEEWVLDNLPLPFGLYVNSDMGNAEYYALYAAAPELFLPDVSYYHSPVGEALLAVLADSGQRLLELAGVENAEEVVRDALAFDAMLLPYIQASEELKAYADLYNPVEMEVFAEFHHDLDLEGLVSALLGQRPEKVIVLNPRYFAAMGDIVTAAHFQKLKHWMLFNTLFQFAGYLDQQFLYTAMAYQMALTGQQSPQNPTELAYFMSTKIFGGAVGEYYGRTYLGDEARADVESMAEEMIQVFRERLLENDWLSEQAIAGAVSKLENLRVNIGFPDEIDPIYSRFIVTEPEAGGSLLSNAMAFSRIAREESFARYGREVDRSVWSMTAHTVNAQYNPVLNAITFPAAILQAPFYCSEQSESANYGGIGAIIAHEITHAFDGNGAQFDETGSLNHWWTEADYAAFGEKIQNMTNLFDGRGYGGGVVNGELTVAENIADAGGLGCALQVVQGLPDGDLEAFFRNWAVIWRMKARPAYVQLLLALDVHAPNQLRTNVQLGNLDAFYEVFSIGEDDGMYIAPENRVKIW